MEKKPQLRGQGWKAAERRRYSKRRDNQKEKKKGGKTIKRRQNKKQMLRRDKRRTAERGRAPDWRDNWISVHLRGDKKFPV